MQPPSTQDASVRHRWTSRVARRPQPVRLSEVQARTYVSPLAKMKKVYRRLTSCCRADQTASNEVYTAIIPCTEGHSVDPVYQHLMKKTGVFKYPPQEKAELSLYTNCNHVDVFLHSTTTTRQTLLRSKSCSLLPVPSPSQQFFSPPFISTNRRFNTSHTQTETRTTTLLHASTAGLVNSTDFMDTTRKIVSLEPLTSPRSVDDIYSSSDMMFSKSRERSYSLVGDLKHSITTIKQNMHGDASEKSGLSTEQMFGIRNNQTISKKGVLGSFVNFDFFTRCQPGQRHPIQMMSGSEYCSPRYADEEQRRRTLRDLTDVQLSGYEGQELARTGWFYNRRTLVTFCCGMEMPVTPAGLPLDVHCSLSPQCEFAKRLRTASQQSSQSSQPQAVQTNTQASGGAYSEIHFSTPVQCTDEGAGMSGSLLWGEYDSFPSAGGLFQNNLQESAPGNHWVMNNESSGGTPAHSARPITGEHDSLVTNRTPLPSEEFRPFVANPDQPSQRRPGGGDAVRQTQTAVGRLAMRTGTDSAPNTAAVLRGLEQDATRRNTVPPFYVDPINMDGSRGEDYVARYPQFAFPTVRAWTFEGWPSDHTQTASMLADAGFFYAGYGDSVLCYCCGIGARFWQPGEDPWIEHARLRRSCLFMQTMQGRHFIEAAVEMARSDQPTYEQVKLEANRRQRAETDGENAAAVLPAPATDTTMLCRVCYQEEMCVVLMPCRHMSVCLCCSGRITSCPVCRAYVESTFQASFD